MSGDGFSGVVAALDSGGPLEKRGVVLFGFCPFRNGQVFAGWVVPLASIRPYVLDRLPTVSDLQKPAGAGISWLISSGTDEVISVRGWSFGRER
jgi:hypothetical protein